MELLNNKDNIRQVDKAKQVKMCLNNGSACFKMERCMSPSGSQPGGIWIPGHAKDNEKRTFHSQGNIIVSVFANKQIKCACFCVCDMLLKLLVLIVDEKVESDCNDTANTMWHMRHDTSVTDLPGRV